MRIIAITQARTGSTRLPGKVLMEINGTTLLGLHLERIKRSKKIDELIVATTVDAKDAAIVEIANLHHVASYRGSVEDVLDRFYQALRGKQVDYVVRLTSDCPLIDPQLIDQVIAFAIDNNFDYATNTLDPTYPDGQDVEVFKYSALARAWEEATLTSEREHVTPFIWKNSTYKGGVLFKSGNYAEGKSFGHLRMTVDETSDFELMKSVITQLGTHRGWLDYATFIEANPNIKEINSNITRNEGYTKSIKKETK